MENSSSKFTQFVTTVLVLIFLLSLVVLEYFLFQRFLDTTYINFWIKQGPLIAFSLTLVGLVWSDLDKQHPDLVSASPGFYLVACVTIMAGVFLAFRNSLPDKQTLEKHKTSWISIWLLRYNIIIGLLIYIVLTAVTFVWLLGIAPTIYFLNLITGAPARLALLSEPDDDISLTRSSTNSEGIKTSESFFLSFMDKPVTLTAALTAGLLILIKLSGIAF